MKMNATHYLFNGTEWRKFEVIDTPIEIKGEKTMDYKVRKTALGPIISTELGDYVMAWTLNQNFDRDNPIKSLIDFNFAKNIDDMHSALRYMLTGFNWVFASNDGNIGYQQSGFIPMRKHGYGLIPKNGSVVNAGWNGLIPYEDQLYVVNPASGYWATANERVDTRELFYISEVYATRHRNDRIEQVLANGTDSSVNPNAITVQDMEHLQADVKTLVAEDLLDPVLNLFKTYRSQTTSDHTTKVIDLLLNWDQRVTVDSVAALVFETYRIMLGKAVFGDEFGDLFNTYVGFRALTEWYPHGNKTIKWFDDITTANKVENSDDMAIKALENTINYLSHRYGTNLSNWLYGDKHRVTLPHVFTDITPIFDIGGDPAPGSSLTVNAISGPDYVDGGISYTSSYGPYFRVVAEVEPTWSNIYVVVSSGASQNPLSPHYRDAYKSWLTFDYHKWYSDKSYIESHYELTAVFRSDKK